MVLIVAVLHIVPGQAQDFELAFREAQQIIAAMPGYESHELKKCVEKTDQYLLHHFYDPFPEVLHYSSVTLD